jgi:hypothetical protein
VVIKKVVEASGALASQRRTRLPPSTATPARASGTPRVAATAEGPDRAGTVDLYEDVGGLWTWVAQVTGPHDNARIGLDSLALDGDLLAIPVGAADTDQVEVLVYERGPAAGWQLLWVLEDPSDYPVGFGHPVVDLDGTTLVVGVPASNDFGVSNGAVHRYDDVRTGLPPVSLYDTDRTTGLWLGHSVTQAGDVVLAVGDPSVAIYRFSPAPIDPAW